MNNHPTQIDFNDGMIELLMYSNPKEKVTTQYGFVEYSKYLSLELSRIRKVNGRKAEIRKDETTGYEALFVDDIAHKDGYLPPKISTVKSRRKSVNYIKGTERPGVIATSSKAMASIPRCGNCKHMKKFPTNNNKRCIAEGADFPVISYSICDNFKQQFNHKEEK